MRKFIKTLALIGFQASGKTSLGRQLAHLLQSAFLDTDQLIEQFHPGLSCHEIFQSFGADYFRYLENQVIHSLKYDPPLIIATGGGSLLLASNGKALKAHSHLIYLKTSEDILKSRIWQKETLPAYLESSPSHQAFSQLYKERAFLYQEWADFTIEMDTLDEQEAINQLLHIAQDKNQF